MSVALRDNCPQGPLLGIHTSIVNLQALLSVKKKNVSESSSKSSFKGYFWPLWENSFKPCLPVTPGWLATTWFARLPLVQLVKFPSCQLLLSFALSHASRVHGSITMGFPSWGITEKMNHEITGESQHGHQSFSDGKVRTFGVGALSALFHCLWQDLDVYTKESHPLVISPVLQFIPVTYGPHGIIGSIFKIWLHFLFIGRLGLYMLKINKKASRINALLIKNAFSSRQ